MDRSSIRIRTYSYWETPYIMNPFVFFAIGTIVEIGFTLIIVGLAELTAKLS